MYLSQLTLNPRHPVVVRALSDLYAMHRLLWRALPEQTKRETDALPSLETTRDGGDNPGSVNPHPLLYRVEAISADGFIRVLAQSSVEPNWRVLDDMPGLLCRADVRPYAPEQQFDTEFEQGRWLQYRLRANPVVSRRKEGREGKTRVVRQGLIQEVDQAAWLMRQGEQHGFALPTWRDKEGNVHPDVRIVSPGILHGNKEERDDSNVAVSKHTIRIFCVDYEGLLSVTDRSKFEQLLKRGLGPAKGLGFGLLSIRRSSW